MNMFSVASDFSQAQRAIMGFSNPARDGQPGPRHCRWPVQAGIGIDLPGKTVRKHTSTFMGSAACVRDGNDAARVVLRKSQADIASAGCELYRVIQQV